MSKYPHNTSEEKAAWKIIRHTVPCSKTIRVWNRGTLIYTNKDRIPGWLKAIRRGQAKILARQSITTLMSRRYNEGS